MKKLHRLYMFASGMFFLPLLFNFINRNKYANTKPPADRRIYNWRFGKISYIVKGKGKPLLLLPDLKPGSNLNELNALVNKYSKQRKVYALDFLGFGYSDKPKLSYSSYLLITLINDFIKDNCGKADVAAFGSSAGLAVISSEFSPLLYDKIFLVNPNGLYDIPKYPSTNDLRTRNVLQLPVFGEFIYNVIIFINALYGKSHSLQNNQNQYMQAAQYKSDGAIFSMAAYYGKMLETRTTRNSIEGRSNVKVITC